MEGDEDDVWHEMPGRVGDDGMADQVGHDESKVIKNTSSSCKQLELDLVLFIVQLGATGPPRYTLILKPNPIA